MAEIEIVELEDFALELAHTAGGIAQAHFRQPITVENKGANGVRSRDERRSRDRARAAQRRSSSAIRSTASSPRKKASAPASGEYTWFIDPIDGTRAFMTGSPLWGTLIGLVTRHAAAVRLARAARARGSVLRRPERQLAHQSGAARSLEEPRLQVAREGRAREHASRHVQRRASSGVPRAAPSSAC